MSAKKIIYFRMPLVNTGITTYYSTKHRAIDMGWNKNYGGKTAPVYSISRAVVSRIYKTTTGGNILELRHNEGETTWIQQFKHLSKVGVKVNQKVNMGEHIANMGSTGTAATGPHLHYALYKCPLGTMVPQTKWAVNPLEYTYAYDDQVVQAKSASKVKRVYGVPYCFAGNVPFENDSTVDSVEVLGDMNCRDAAKGKVLGECVNGFFKFTDKAKKGDYTWYKIGDNRWVANVNGKVEVIPAGSAKLAAQSVYDDGDNSLIIPDDQIGIDYDVEEIDNADPNEEIEDFEVDNGEVEIVGFHFSDHAYEVAKYIAMIVLPAVATLYSTLSSIWNFPFQDEIPATVMAIDLFMGALLKISSDNYYKSLEKASMAKKG